jgi:hypothetical protein
LKISSFVIRIDDWIMKLFLSIVFIIGLCD